MQTVKLMIEIYEDEKCENVLTWDSKANKAWLTAKHQDLCEVSMLLSCVAEIQKWQDAMSQVRIQRSGRLVPDIQND